MHFAKWAALYLQGPITIYSGVYVQVASRV
jgi:hypothetical protein